MVSDGTDAEAEAEDATPAKTFEEALEWALREHADTLRALKDR